MEAKEQAAGYVPIVFTQESGKPITLDRWEVTAWVVKGKIRFRLVDRGPQISGTAVDGAIDSCRI